MNSQTPEVPPGGEEGSTGLPVFRTWPAVYALVLAVFVGVVVLLALFTRAYS